MSHARRPFRTGRLLAAVAVALLATACGTTPPTPSEAGTAGRTTITVGNGPFLSNVDLHLAASKGYFREAGLDADIKVLAAGSNAVPQLINGSMQFAAVDVATAITAVGQRLPVVVVAPNIVGSPGDVGYAGVLVSPASGITTPSELPGRTIAVNQINGTAMVLTKAALQNAGVDWRKVNFTEVAPPQLLPTLAAGRADSAVLGEPGVAGAESQGMKYLFNLEQSTVPGSAAFVYIALKSYVTEHPDVTKAFANTILKSHVEANKDPDLVRELAKTSTDIDPALLAKVTLPTFGENAVQPKEIDTWIGLLEQYGELDKSKAPAASDVLGL